MKRFCFTIFFCLSAYCIIYAQTGYPGYVEDFHPPEGLHGTVLLPNASRYSPNGQCFTPKGELRALIICAGFGAPWDNYDVPGWSAGANTLPNSAYNSMFYSDNSFFNNPISASDKTNISRYLYEMSTGTLKFTADFYPTRITIDATGSPNFYQLNQKVLEKMRDIDPNFEWNRYDKRRNSPNYMYDYSGNQPDMKPDFIVIMYRFGNDLVWKSNPPVSGMHSWSGASGGFTPAYGVESVQYSGYTFNPYCGYTHCLGSANFYDLFIHELAHALYECPHYANANNVVGNFFYGQYGAWGMMKKSSGAFSCANGWERWYLGWIELTSNGVNSDIKSNSDLPSNREFILRDFMTTGDVVRIKIPNGTGTDQHLWLENHKGTSIYDDRNWDVNGCNPHVMLPPSPRGLVAYIESIPCSRENPLTSIYAAGAANGIKVIHPAGNYNYSAVVNSDIPCELWDNAIYNIIEKEENPISGQCRTEGIRLDFNGDNVIAVDEDGNAPGTNERHWVAKRNGNMTYDFIGHGINFGVGRKIGMTTNPPLLNRPLYNKTTQQMSPHYLNGITVEVVSMLSNGDIKIKVTYNDVTVNSDILWAGNIVLPDITANSNPDIIMSTGKTLTITKSGTPNRHTKTQFTGEFINPTTFTCAASSYFKMNAGSKVIVDNLSTLVLESNSKLEVEDGAVLTIKAGASLKISAGANLVVKGFGRVEIEPGAFICIENGANINLVSNYSFINLHNGYNIGLNPIVHSSSSSCLSNLSNYITSGLGSINTYSNDKYVQNETFNTNAGVTGRYIFVGSNVTTTKPSGPVKIRSSANVFFDADNDVIIQGGFETEQGALFEVR